jgi:hypothetical protein
MTWNELANEIHGMTSAQREQTAQFRESYDDGPEIIPVDVIFAEEDLRTSDGDVGIEKGDPFLA